MLMGENVTGRKYDATPEKNRKKFREIENFFSRNRNFLSDFILRACIKRMQSFIKIGQVVPEKSVPDRRHTDKRSLLLGYIISRFIFFIFQDNM